jgi:hypothetical protein
MNEDELEDCHGKTITITARHLMEHKFPKNRFPNLKFGEVSKEIKSAIRGRTCILILIVAPRFSNVVLLSKL